MGEREESPLFGQRDGKGGGHEKFRDRYLLRMLDDDDDLVRRRSTLIMEERNFLSLDYDGHAI